MEYLTLIIIVAYFYQNIKMCLHEANSTPIFYRKKLTCNSSKIISIDVLSDLVHVDFVIIDLMFTIIMYNKYCKKVVTSCNQIYSKFGKVPLHPIEWKIFIFIISFEFIEWSLMNHYEYSGCILSLLLSFLC